MKKQRRNLWVSLCGAFAALGLAFGIFVSAPVQAAASDTVPTLTMDAGASIRKKDEPGIKFTATIADSMEEGDGSYNYGMLILPAATWDTLGWWSESNVDYIAELSDLGKKFGEDYVGKECQPYLANDGTVKISLSMTNIHYDNYAQEFIGVAYAEKDGNYIYAPINAIDNARSITYVAQKALIYEDELSSSQELALLDYANPGIEIGKDSYFTDDKMEIGSETQVVAAEYALKYNFNVTDDRVTQITKAAYPGGTKISFKYYIPEGTIPGWWGIAWHTDASKANNYHAAGVENPVGYQGLSNATGTWMTASFTLPANGPYYLYFGSEMGNADNKNWTLNGLASYALIKDFTIDGQTQVVGEIVSNGIFDIKVPGAMQSYLVKDGSISFEESIYDIPVVETESAVKIDICNINGSTSNPDFITAEKYTGNVTVTFDYYISGNPSWWTLGWTTSKTKADIYAGVAGEHTTDTNSAKALPTVTDSWASASVELPAGEWYLYFAGAKGEWKNSYVLIDNIKIGDTVVETFNRGLENSIFEVNSNAVTLGNGYVEPTVEEGEYAMKYIFNASGETVSQVTKEAYAGGSTISFKYYITETVSAKGWWGLAYKATNTGLSVYDAAGSSKFDPGKTVGEWVDVSFTLPSGGPYYLYFGSSVGEWKNADSSNPYVLIDNFTINGETETFNTGVADSIFEVLVPGAVVEGEGFETVEGCYGAKIQFDLISSTASTPSFITKQAYTFAEPTVVTFDYYMSGNTNKKWWTLAWTNNNKVASIYAGVSSSHTTETNNAKSLATNIQDTWVTATVEIPAGTWYLYFGGAVGEWSGGSVIIDNFAIGDDLVETFNDGTYGIFVDNRDSKPDAITIAEGLAEFVPGEYSAKLDFSKSFDNNAKTLITKTACVKAGSTISFQYMIPEETTIGDWWAICWDTNGASPDFWAVGNGNVAGNGGINPNPNKLKGQGWVEYSFTLPAGDEMYYLYFTGYQNWSGYVYIDNIVITAPSGEKLVEDFTNGYEDGSMFANNNPGYVSLGEGCTDVVEEETPDDGEVIFDYNSLAYLLKNGTVVEYLENDGYFATLKPASGIEIKPEDLPASTLLLEGVINYSITGNKEFAIYFGNESFLFINETTIALYNGTQLIKEIASSAAKVTLVLSVTVDGKVLVNMGETNIGLAKMSDTATEVKLVALGGDGSVQFNSIAINTYYARLVGVPVYLSDDQIDFTAYAFDSAAMVTETGFKLLAEAGFTKTLGLLQGRCAGDLHEQDIPDRAHVEKLMAEVNADALAAITLAEKYGMKHYVINSNLYNIERNPNNYEWLDEFADLATYTLSEAFAGHFLADEPQSGKWFTDAELEELVNAYKEYKKAFPEGEAFINLLPRDSAQFTSESMYTDYVEYYITHIAKDYNGVPGTGYVSFDHYPLHEDGITSTHLRNLEIVAGMCQEYGVELRTYIKASTTGDAEREIRATESVNDLYMQIYSALAYGSKEIIYYQFTDHTATDGAGDGVISGSSLEKGNVYNWTKQANNEVAAFSAAYMNFTWKSASVFGKTSLTQFNKLNDKVSAYGSLTGVTSSASVLVGNFDDTDSKYGYGAKNAYMVVNYGNTDNMTHATSEITLTFNGMTRAIVYENGQATVVTLNNNQLTLNLEIGEGAFVIPLTSAK